jgi:cellulose synthase (UDP-forming)
MIEFLQAAAPSLLVLGCTVLWLSYFHPENNTARAIAALVVAVFMARYLCWRLTETLPSSAWTASVVCSYLFLALEILSPAPGVILLHSLSRTIRRSAEVDSHPLEHFAGGPPMVDVFIPTYNESREILERTIAGSLALDYPRFRVWVLDDSRRPWLKEVAENLGAYYLTRYENSHGKAGNMNNGLVHVLALPEPPEIIAIFDADFVAMPQFLRRTVVLMHDPTVGVVQTPQHFFNPDPVQLNLGAPKLVPDEQRFFFDVILASKDAHGTAFSCGTSSICRVAALKTIGGFPTESVTEDMLLSIKMTTIGCRTVYLNERLSVGLAPEGMQEYITQRGRWCLGTMQIARTNWGPFSRKTDIPLLMRLHVLDSILYWSIGTLIRFATILIPILYWWFGIIVMDTDMYAIVSNLGPFWIASVAFIAWISRGTTIPILTEAMGLVMSMEVAKASAIGLFGSKNQKFKVTAKGGNRFDVIVQWGIIKWLLLASGLTIGGIAYRVISGPVLGTPRDIETVNLFWSLFNVCSLLTACMICVEQPRYRREERFNTAEPVKVAMGNNILAGIMHDISLVGARVSLPHGLQIEMGHEVIIHMSGVQPLRASIVRITPEKEYGLEFFPDVAAKVELVRKLFSGQYIDSIQSMSTLHFARALVKRVFT